MIRGQTIFPALCLLLLCFTQSPVLANSANPSKTWSKQQWLAGATESSRAKLFAELLKQKNLIGLSQKKVEKLIGVPESDGFYRLSHDCCGAIVLRIDYEKKRVQRWRLESCGYNGHAALSPEAWVETNVVLNCEDGHLIPFDVVPKSKANLKSKKLNS